MLILFYHKRNILHYACFMTLTYDACPYLNSLSTRHFTLCVCKPKSTYLLLLTDI